MHKEFLPVQALWKPFPGELRFVSKWCCRLWTNGPNTSSCCCGGCFDCGWSQNWSSFMVALGIQTCCKGWFHQNLPSNVNGQNRNEIGICRRMRRVCRSGTTRVAAAKRALAFSPLRLLQHTLGSGDALVLTSCTTDTSCR